MRVILLAVFAHFTLATVFAQTDGDYRSAGTGDWDQPGTWEMFSGGNWAPAGASPTSADGVITLRSGHTVTITQNVSVDQLTIQLNGLVVVSSGVDLTITNGAGNDLAFTAGFGVARMDVSGRIIIEEGAVIASSSASRLRILTGGFYRHNYTTSPGTIYPAGWQNGSTLEITGYTSNSTPPAGLAQDFYNVTWDCQNFSEFFLDLDGGLMSVGGDLQILSTNGGYLVFGQNNNFELNIAGDLSVSGNSALAFNGFSFITSTITVGGDFSYNSSGESWFAVDGALQMAVSGSFSASSGTIDLSNDGGTGQGSSTIQVGGNLELTGGVVTKTSSDPSSAALFILNGGGIQTFTGGGSISNDIDFTVSAGSTLDLGTSSLGGTGVFTCNGTVQVGSLDAGGAVQGNIPINTRIFSAGSTLVYNGVAAQFMGTAHPSTTGVNTLIDNSSGVTLTSNVVVGGDLTLTSGNLTVGNNTLTLGSDVIPNGNSIIVVAGSSIAINGFGAFGTFPFPSGPQTLTNFSLNRSNGSVVFANDVTLTGALTFEDGNLDFSGTTLTLNGTFNSTGGLFASTSNESALIIGGNGAFGTLAFDPAANVLGTLTLDRASSGTASLNSNLFVENQLNLLSGEFTNTSGLKIGDGAVVTRNSNGELLGTFLTNDAEERYSVVYTGGNTFTTGLELPTTTNNDLLNLTISAPVTLDKNIIVNGNLTLQNSTLTGTTNITMAGNPGTWSNQGGAFNPGSGSVIITGNITIDAPSNIPQFGNLTTNSGSTLTMPTGTTNVSGNLQFDQGSTFNANGGTIVFNGNDLQVVSGGGRNFNNITVNKSGGNLQLTSRVRLNGILDVASSTEVQADGSLTVVSTSDGTTGNGSIGPLTSGASVTGDVAVQRFMGEEGRIYRYISSPVSGVTVENLQDDFFVTGDFVGADTGCPGCSNNPSMFYYDEATSGGLEDGYFQFPVSSNTENLTPGRGYAAFIRDDAILGPVTIDLTGPINQGTVALPVTRTLSGNAYDGYNLVGNPFPATIDWDATSGWSKTSIAATIAVKNNGGDGNFLYWDGEEGGLPGGHIATGQGFWVRAAGVGPSLSVNETAKINATGEFFREKKVTPDVFRLVLSDGDVTDRAYFRFRKEANAGLDDYDAPKMNNDRFDISTLSSDDMPMAINASNEMPCDNTLRVHIKDLEQGAYTLSSEAVGVFTGTKASLVDNFTGAVVDFSVTPQYAFSVTSNSQSSAPDRFLVTLGETTIETDAVIPAVGSTCAEGAYEVELEGTQRGIYYFAQLDGIALSDSVLSDGTGNITLSIPDSSLTVGLNQITLSAYNYCSSLPMANSITIDHDIQYTVTSSDVSECEGSPITLQASGAPENGSYNWYEEETSVDPIEAEHGATFVIPELTKAKTYYVAAVNSKGCEGPRVAVKASVVPYVAVEITESPEGEFVSSYQDGNQWYLDGEAIDGATSQTFTATQSGTYTVEVDLGGCITSATADFLVTGVDEFDPSRFLNVYQNPFIDELRIRVGTPRNVEQMSVFNNIGTKVGDLQLTRTGNSTEGVIDMTHSASGMYFVKTFVEGRVYTMKVIKK